MNENVNQSLSAMIDDETESFETRRTLDQLDDEAIQTWSRYNLVSAALKGEEMPRLDISKQVMQALEDEPALQIEKDKTGFFAKPVASVAIAASVTAMVIFGVQSFQTTGTSALQVSQQSSPAPNVVLPAQQTPNAALMPAQYGSLPAPTASLNTAEVIRLDDEVGKYIQQHQSMRDLGDKEWVAHWLPKGYLPLSHDVHHDTEVMRFTDGDKVISIFVEPNAKVQQPEGVVHSGDTVALSKKKGSQLVTVVGDMPLLVADRIASSVHHAQ